MDVEQKIKETGLIPVAAFDRAADAVPAAEAVAAGGVDVMEITLRTAAGLQAIEDVRARCASVTVGAGTVLTLQQARDAVSAGAEFIVSTGLDEAVCAWCLEQGVAVFPGCVTPTEIQRGLSLGLHTFKFFPASVYGGVKACKALYAPFRSAGVSFIPTGGVDLSNLADYASAPFVAAIGGGWLCDGAAVAAGEFAQLTRTAERSVAALLGFSFAHLGVNPGGERNLAELASLIGLPEEARGNPHFLLNASIENCPAPAPGTHGHIAVKTNHILRAARYLEKRGIEFDWENAKRKGDRLAALYFRQEFGGFAVHLLQA